MWPRLPKIIILVYWALRHSPLTFLRESTRLFVRPLIVREYNFDYYGYYATITRPKITCWVYTLQKWLLHRFILKNNHMMLSPLFTFISKTGVGLPKTGSSFYCRVANTTCEYCRIGPTPEAIQRLSRANISEQQPTAQLVYHTFISGSFSVKGLGIGMPTAHL